MTAYQPFYVHTKGVILHKQGILWNIVLVTAAKGILAILFVFVTFLENRIAYWATKISLRRHLNFKNCLCTVEVFTNAV